MAKEKVTEGYAAAILILNLVLPGLGSIIAKRTIPGVWQLVLYSFGWVLTLLGLFLTATIILIGVGIPMVIIGICLVLVGYIWGIVTGILLISESK
jgi:hypothetical protein